MKESFKCLCEETVISEKLCEGDIEKYDKNDATPLGSEEDTIRMRLENCTTT